MNFDKSKIYTSVNADEVKIGSKGYFADTLTVLEECVRYGDSDGIRELGGITDPLCLYRFRSTPDNVTWNLFYLVEEPEEEEFCTYRELAKWLMYGTGEYLRNNSCTVSTHFHYELEKENERVNPIGFKVRKWGDAEWHEPTRRYMGIEE